MDSFSRALVRCRVLYLGSIPLEESDIVGVETLQSPLSKRYKDGENDGVDARLLVYSGGIQIQFVQNAKALVWFPISRLSACAAVKCVTYINGSTGRSDRKFVPVDGIGPELSDCSPPIFTFVSKVEDVSVSHIFICKSDQASLMLVQCCTSAHENRDPMKDDVPPKHTIELPPEGGFIGNSHRYVSIYDVSNPNAEKITPGFEELLVPPPRVPPPRKVPERIPDFDARSMHAPMPSQGPPPGRGMKVVYAPESVVNSGPEAVRRYFANLENGGPRPRDYATFSPTSKFQPVQSPRSLPRSQTLSHAPRVPNGRATSPAPDYDAPPRRRRNSAEDCPICNPRISRIDSEAANCSICNPHLASEIPAPPVFTPPSIPTHSNNVKSNPIVRRPDEPDLPPVDYDDFENGEDLPPMNTQYPKLDDVMRRRAESIMGDSVKDQVILRENRGRRVDNLGGRLASTNLNRNERAFSVSIGEENRSRGPMVVGHGPSNVYEMNGVVGDRLFDDLQTTLGYYP